MEGIWPIDSGISLLLFWEELGLLLDLDGLLMFWCGVFLSFDSLCPNCFGLGMSWMSDYPFSWQGTSLMAT